VFQSSIVILQAVLEYMHSSGVTIQVLQQLLCAMPYTAGFGELLQYLQSLQPGKVQAIILSDSNTQFIDWILSSRGHAGIFRQARQSMQMKCSHLCLLLLIISHECGYMSVLPAMWAALLQLTPAM